jgi:Na+-transporting methylmalonyl-CoA/oxaloacetate decarboxylase beta subunit
MSIRAYCFELLVLTVFALFLSAMIVWGGIVHFGAIMTEHEQALRAARDSLRNVVSIRDFLLAVQVGSKTAVAMLDKVESKLLEVLEAINEDAP